MIVDKVGGVGVEKSVDVNKSLVIHNFINRLLTGYWQVINNLSTQDGNTGWSGLGVLEWSWSRGDAENAEGDSAALWVSHNTTLDSGGFVQCVVVGGVVVAVGGDLGA